MVQRMLKFKETSDKKPRSEFRRADWKVPNNLPSLGDYQISTCEVHEDGKFSLHGLPRGPVTIGVYYSRRLVREVTVTLPLPEEEELVIEVE
jgi:hypothetical protein